MLTANRIHELKISQRIAREDQNHEQLWIESLRADGLSQYALFRGPSWPQKFNTLDFVLDQNNQGK